MAHMIGPIDDVEVMRRTLQEGLAARDEKIRALEELCTAKDELIAALKAGNDEMQQTYEDLQAKHAEAFDEAVRTGHDHLQAMKEKDAELKALRTELHEANNLLFKEQMKAARLRNGGELLPPKE